MLFVVYDEYMELICRLSMPCLVHLCRAVLKTPPVNLCPVLFVVYDEYIENVL